MSDIYKIYMMFGHDKLKTLGPNKNGFISAETISLGLNMYGMNLLEDQNNDFFQENQFPKSRIANGTLASDDIDFTILDYQTAAPLWEIAETQGGNIPYVNIAFRDTKNKLITQIYLEDVFITNASFDTSDDNQEDSNFSIKFMKFYIEHRDKDDKLQGTFAWDFFKNNSLFQPDKSKLIQK